MNVVFGACELLLERSDPLVVCIVVPSSFRERLFGRFGARERSLELFAIRHARELTSRLAVAAPGLPM